MIASKLRVFTPDAVRNMFACIGSVAQTTGWPASLTARTIGGSESTSRSAPIRTISVSRPGRRVGFSSSQSSSTSSAAAAGPSFTPSGLLTPAKNSTCAPPSARVRSPIQSMCAEQSYQSPVSESRRVSASS